MPLPIELFERDKATGASNLVAVVGVLDMRPRETTLRKVRFRQKEVQRFNRSSLDLHRSVVGMGIVSALFVHIGHILLMSSEEQVFRVYAGGIITGMADFFAFRDFTIEVLVRKFVSRHDLSARTTKLAIAPDAPLRSGPQPAGFSLLNSPQESLNRRRINPSSSHNSPIALHLWRHMRPVLTLGLYTHTSKRNLRFFKFFRRANELNPFNVNLFCPSDLG